jgi:tetratricopeptide (TPR) repeat protein
LIFQGKHLSALQETANSYLEFQKKTNNRWATDMIAGTQMILNHLLGISDKTTKPFSHEGKSETDFYESCEEISNYSALSRYFIFKALALYVMGDYRQARAAIEEGERHISFLFGTIYSAEYVFADSLTLAGLLDIDDCDHGYTARIRTNQKKMKVWADNAPENFYHRYLLIEAELKKHSKNPLDAVDVYDQAIQLASESGFLQNEALANEMAGRFWLARNKKEFALIYLTKAYSCYRRWGASRKLDQMKDAYPEFSQGLLHLMPSLVDEEMRGDVNLERLDIDMLIKALQAISAEIILENLLDKLMSFVIMNAGADRGVLFIRKKEQFYLEAEIRAGEQSSTLLQTIPLEDSSTPLSLIRYVARTQELVVIDDAREDVLLEQDEYIQRSSLLLSSRDKMQ